MDELVSALAGREYEDQIQGQIKPEYLPGLAKGAWAATEGLGGEIQALLNALAGANVFGTGMLNREQVAEKRGIDLSQPGESVGQWMDFTGPLGKLAGVLALGAKAPKAAGLLGKFGTTTPGRIANQTKQHGGYTVNLGTGQIPEEGLMMGKYANDSGKNLVTPMEGGLTRSGLEGFAKQNEQALSRVENYLGTWLDDSTNTLYADVATKFGPGETRKATKFGERTGQLAGFDIGKMDEFPVGNWQEFIKSPEFSERMLEMQDVGQKYLKQHATDEWWDIHGTLFEKIYGRDNLEVVAGMIASTAPNTNPTQNVRLMSEYMRRYLIGEDVVQPNWRVPAGTQTRNEGKRLGMHENAPGNLINSSKGDISALRADKVREEGQALMGDPNAVVLDRWWARVAENPKEGVFTGTQEGAFPRATKSRNPYQELKQVITETAQSVGRDPRDFSADVWTGIRETVKKEDQLFGTPFKGSAVAGESKSYADIFEDLVDSKAKFLGITRDEFESRLARGDAELLGLIVGTPLGAHLYSQYAGGAASAGDGHTL